MTPFLPSISAVMNFRARGMLMKLPVKKMRRTPNAKVWIIDICAEFWQPSRNKLLARSAFFTLSAKKKAECNSYFINFGWAQVLFVGSLIPMFWTSGDVPSGFQSQSGQPLSCLAEAYILHIPWDSPLVQHLLAAEPAWQLSCSLRHTCEQALVEVWNRNLLSLPLVHSVTLGRRRSIRFA